jgi:hypothetical protein
VSAELERVLAMTEADMRLLRAENEQLREASTGWKTRAVRALSRADRVEVEAERLQRLLWECHRAASDGIPVPFSRWLADGGPDGMPQDIRELRDAYDTVSEAEFEATRSRAATDDSLAPRQGGRVTAQGPTVYVCEICGAKRTERGNGQGCAHAEAFFAEYVGVRVPYREKDQTCE